MKVLQLGPFPPPHGGVQTNLVGIRNYLRDHGATCSVINITRHRKPDIDGVYYPHGVWQLTRLLLRLQSDVIHLHIGGDLTPRLVGLTLLCTLLPGRVVVLTFHSGGYPSSAAGLRTHRWTVAGFVFRKLDGLIGVNQELMSLFDRLGVQSTRLRLIPPHAVPALSSGGKLSPDLRAFFDHHSPVLLSVGLLEPEYDLPLQIEAVGKVRDRFPNAGLVLIGSGSLEKSLVHLIRAKPYAEHILLCGDVPHKMTLQAMAHSSVLLRTTRYDGDSISVREALHLGVPVIATDNGMRPAGVCLVPIGDLEALVHAILARGESCIDRQRLQDQAGSENLEAVVRFYEDLIGEKRGTGAVR